MLSEEITGLIVDLVTCDLCPDALVEEKGSKSLMKFNVLNLDIKFPQRHTLLNWFEKKNSFNKTVQPSGTAHITWVRACLKIGG